MRAPRRARRRMLVIAFACLLLLALATPIGIASYLAFVRTPSNSPDKVCGAVADARSVVVAGASIVQGSLGADWVTSLQDRPELAGYSFVNAGVSGNTSADLRARVDTDILACRPDAVMILVGTNDVLQGVSTFEYEANLAAIIDRIREHTAARIALMSLPPLGEDLGGETNRTLSDYNAVVRKLSAQHDVDYLPIHERIAELLRPGADRPSFDFSPALAFSAAIQHYVLGRSWDDVAERDGRELLIDHIHLSDRGATVVAELAAPWLATGERDAHEQEIP